jgi:DNA-binding HxlR family transcriptional regulator
MSSAPGGARRAGARYTRTVPKRYAQSCPVAKSLEFLGERWTLLIVRDLLGSPRRFHDLRASLKSVTPAVLSQRLKVLETRGIVRRRLYSDHPPRAEYALTARGLELRAVVRALAVWGARHVHRDSALVHDACGGRIDIAYYCPECEALVPTDDVRHERFRRPAAAPVTTTRRRAAPAGPRRGSRRRA